MKKIFALLVILLLVPLTVAQNETSNETGAPTYEEPVEGAGTLPNSVFYGLDRAIERIQIRLAANEEKRINLRLEHALERLNEVQEMQRLRIQERLNETIEDFESELEDIDAEIEVAENKALGLNVTQLRAHVREMQQKQIQVLERVLENAPESAQPALTQVLNRARERNEIREQKFGEWVQKLQEQEREREREQNYDNESDEPEMEQEREREHMNNTSNSGNNPNF